MVDSYCKHRNRIYQRRESHSPRHRQHIHKSTTKSLTRNYYSGSGDYSYQSPERQHQILCYNEDRKNKPSGRRNSRHYMDNFYRYGFDSDESETSSYSSTNSTDTYYERIPRYDRKYARRRSRRSSHRTLRSKSIITPGCRGCQQQAVMPNVCPHVDEQRKISASYDTLKQANSRHKQRHHHHKQHSESQQASENILQTKEFGELKRAVYNIINGFTRSLRNHEWYPDLDNFGANKNGKNKGRESDWVQIY
ncbi:unnamed protein product [Rodentolepis nana]|uniref:Uncharacterized protein n=1 Tax=Rodentolepis nana TaxID=102285 RepID=A0A0R3TPE5_RODNA|nr:unnamed protein product [Rodentolepis nana]